MARPPLYLALAGALIHLELADAIAWSAAPSPRRSS